MKLLEKDVKFQMLRLLVKVCIRYISPITISIWLALRKIFNSNRFLYSDGSKKEEGQRLFDEDCAGSGDDDNDRDDPLRRTNTPFGGMINDIKRRAPYYKSDYLQGINGQCFSAAIFMYFAALSAAITFGGLFG